MKILCLGTGTFPCLTRANSSFLINDDLLIDIGSGTLRQLEKYNCQTKNIRYLCITHYHADHFFDIAAFLMTRVLKNEKGQLLTIIGPPNLKNRIKELLSIHSDHEKDDAYDNLEEKYGIVIIEMCKDNDYCDLGKYKIKQFNAKQNNLKNVNSYIIYNEKDNCCFTGDTTVCSELDENIKKVNNIFIDSSFMITDSKYHLGYDMILKYADQYKNCMFYPIHRNDYEITEMRKNIKILIDGDIITTIKNFKEL